MVNLTPSIDILAQGGLFKLHVTRPDVKRVVVNATRGQIYEFSRRSRKRLLEKTARLDYSQGKTIFVTLTYPFLFPSPARAKEQLRAFLKRLAYHCRSKGIAAIWRLEFQKRGAPHFHLMLFGLPFVDKADIQAMWMSVLHTKTRVFTRIEMIQSARHARYYISKYVAKTPHPKSRICSVREQDTGIKGANIRRWRGFNTRPYLAKTRTSVNRFTGEILENNTGRWWGVINKAALPFAEPLSIEITEHWYHLLYNLKRYLRRVYPKTTKHTYRGGTLFCTDASRWYELVLFEILRE